MSLGKTVKGVILKGKNENSNPAKVILVTVWGQSSQQEEKINLYIKL